MKDNGYYQITDSPEGGKVLTLLPGCIVDYEILLTELIGSIILQHKDIELEKPKNPWEVKEDLIKVNKTTTIEIKTVQPDRGKKFRAFH